ncbi:MAG: triphosphoribosyl-dephospho-CoA synthase [Methylococcales bacterium]|nr:MAG: triphosphoribosyl-dephospho-CoA synthase [Methylococcales bacterium]
MMLQQQLSTLYQQACEIELQAFKPGNVSVYAEGHDMTVADFRVSAKVSADALCNTDYSLGEKIYYAVQATNAAVACNTNLGIILLCAPLIQAMSEIKQGISLRQALQQVLISTTIDDADWVFKAIMLASPGGLGRADDQDVSEKPSITLIEAMRLSSHKDRIALQYVSDYQDIFDFAVPIHYNAVRKSTLPEWAALSVYAALLSHFPDSHIERKFGKQYSEMVAQRMSKVSSELSMADVPEQILPLLYSLDQEFKAKGLNPGTMADMTVATVFTVFLEEVIKLTLHNKNLPI